MPSSILGHRKTIENSTNVVSAFMEFVLYFRRDGQVVNRQLTTSILINVMKEIILRCYMFSRRGWISTLLFASDWTPNPTDLSNYRKFMGEYYYKVTDQTGFMCSCVQGLANIRRWALFFSLFCLHCVGLIHKLHMVRPKKFSSQHHNLKSRRRKSLLSEITKKTLWTESLLVLSIQSWP